MSLVVVIRDQWFGGLVPILPSEHVNFYELYTCLGSEPARQDFIELAKNASKFLIPLRLERARIEWITRRNSSSRVSASSEFEADLDCGGTWYPFRGGKLTVRVSKYRSFIMPQHSLSVPDTVNLQ